MLCVCWWINRLQVCKCTHTHTNTPTSTPLADTITSTLFSLNKKEILSFGIIQMNQAIVLNELNHIQEDSTSFHFCVESEIQTQEHRGEWCSLRVGFGEMEG